MARDADCRGAVFVVFSVFECLGVRASSGSVEVGFLPEDSPHEDGK